MVSKFSKSNNLPGWLDYHPVGYQKTPKKFVIKNPKNPDSILTKKFVKAL